MQLANYSLAFILHHVLRKHEVYLNMWELLSVPQELELS